MGQLTSWIGRHDGFVAGRYRVEAALGRGAMGEVLQVRDDASGDRLALKRLLRPSQDRLAASLFEREYHTLASLRHPRIIQVFEYGHSDLGPYYTMELLPGADLRELSPLPYAQACRYLGDVASSLALLHARRLLHRDLNARNVRVSAEGHCKLIDFGALATFGSHREIIGAPPCVAPEALRGMPLDQRSDLYALGTLAYYLLTGRNAFQVRRIEDLEAAFDVELRSPGLVLADRASAAGTTPEIGSPPAIPEPLDALVMSLLSRDPDARPSSAAEVIEQLSQIAELQAPPLPEVARGYLAGGRLIGREHELRGIEAAVAQARAGRGGGWWGRAPLGRCAGPGGARAGGGPPGAVLIAGPSGVGKTRLLSELSLQAQLAGAAVVRADAGNQIGPYGVVRALVTRLFEVLPEPAFDAALPHAELLARFAPQMAAHVEGATPAICNDETPGELRTRTQVALREWFLALAAERRIALIVDDLEGADEASLALLSRLAKAAREHGLLVCGTADVAQLERGTTALRGFEIAAQVLRPEPLDAEQTGELLRALFGDVPNIKRLAHFAHERTSGLPQRIYELSETLIGARVLRVFDGIWIIPAELEGQGLDLRGEHALARARLAQLSPAARVALELFSLRRAALPLELWLALAAADARDSGQGEPAVRAAFRALDELISAGLIVGAASGLRFATEWMRVHVETGLVAARRARLHLELGRLLLEQPELDSARKMEAGFHLLRGGDETRGADLLAELGLELVRDADEMSAAAPALEAALAIYERQARPLHQRCRLLGPLAVAGYRSDLRLAERYGERAIVQQEQLLGLALARRLRPWAGARVSLYLGLTFGVVRSLCAHGKRGLSAFRDAIGLFIAACNSLCGAAATCLDAERAGRASRALEPLSWLGHNHVCNVAYRYTQALTLVAQDRQAEASQLLREVVAALQTRNVRDLPVGARSMFLGGAIYALGVLEAFRDQGDALALAEQLGDLGLRLYDLAADQVRATHYANRGETELAEEYAKRVELHAIDAGSGWQAEVWAPCAALNQAGLLRDVILLRRAGEQLEPLAARVPSLRFYAELAGRAYRGLRGEPNALDECVEWLRAVPARSFNGWASAIAMLGYMLNQRGDHARARELCGWALSQLSARDLEYTAFTLKLEVHHAHALAGLGEPDRALAELDALAERHGTHTGPLSLGFLHEYLARVSALAGDGQRVRVHVEAMTRAYEMTGHSGLIALAARMRALTPSQWPSRPSRPEGLG